MLPTDLNIKESLSEGLTQSEIMERANCPRKHLFRYILNLKRQGSFSWALAAGSAVHQLLELHYNLLKDTGEGLKEIKVADFEFEPDVILQPEQYEELKYWQMITAIMVWHHNRYHAERDAKIRIDHIEVPIDYEYRGIRLRGMIDLVGQSETRGSQPWIMDHKTASDINDIRMEGWQFRFQFLFYSWLWWKVSGERPSGNYVNILKKPQERRSTKKNETVEDFCRRVDINIQAEASNYFRREWIPLDDGMLERFQRFTLDPMITDFQMLQELADAKNRFTDGEKEAFLLRPNTDSCVKWNVKCEFLELCKENFQDFAMEYIKRPEKHVELSNNKISL